MVLKPDITVTYDCILEDSPNSVTPYTNKQIYNPQAKMQINTQAKCGAW